MRRWLDAILLLWFGGQASSPAGDGDAGTAAAVNELLRDVCHIIPGGSKTQMTTSDTAAAHCAVLYDMIRSVVSSEADIFVP